MDKNDSSTTDPLSPPSLPDDSVGSSVSSRLQHEYDDLLRYSVVIPQYNTNIGPQILENSKGLFLTTKEQIELRQENNAKLKAIEKTNAVRLDVNKIDTAKANGPVKQKENNDESHDEQDTFEGMSSTLSIDTTFDSLSPRCDGLLIPANANIRNCNNNNNLSITTHDLTNLTRNNQSNNSSSSSSVITNDINPRKHSPVPMSPPPQPNTDFNVTAENSIDILLKTYTNYANNLNKNRMEHRQHGKENKSAHSLDKWFKEFKTHVVSEFEKSKTKILQDQQKKLSDEKEKQASETAKLRKDIETMQMRLNDYEKAMSEKDVLISNLTVALEKQKEKTELQHVMMEWKVKKLESNKDGFTMKIAEKYYQQRIKAKLFLNWHILLTNRHKLKVEKACRKKAEEICLDLANQYESKIKKLNEELKFSRDDIEKYKYEMGKYEENMKRALMRGVCALNLEAMSIFTSKDDISLSSNRKSFNTHNFDRNGTINTYHSDDDITKGSRYSHIHPSSNKKSNGEIDDDGTKQRVQFNETVKVIHDDSINDSFDDGPTTVNNENCMQTRTTGLKYVQTPPLPAKVFTNLSDHGFSSKKPQQRITTPNFKATARSKVNSQPQSATYPFRSIVIEKHSKNQNDEKAKSQIRYTPPIPPSMTPYSSQHSVKRSSLFKC